jgi:hypothetical protein
MREWCKYKANLDWYYDRPITKSKYGKILTKLTDKNNWEFSDYTNSNHPFYGKVINTKDEFRVIESYYFNTNILKILLNYFENDLETKMQKLIDNPPTLEPDSPFFDEPYALETVSFKNKTIIMDLIHKEFREVWSLSITVESLQDEVNKKGGLYIIFAEYIGE